MGDEHTGPLDTGPLDGGRVPTSGLPAVPRGAPDLTRATAPEVPRTSDTRHPASAIPTRLGRYTIIRVLGEGGMGTVYEAQQESPRRTVALKVIRAGYLSPELLRRFTQESQVLGRLQHPGIAQVYEAGVFEARADEEAASSRASSPSSPSSPSCDSSPASASAASPSVTSPLGHFATPPLLPSPIPFFAMEFIKGVPLTEYVNQKKLGTRDRLELVAKVCDAVYHAHQKGVIHRDLKPGNILVDESGQPKILDFGIARATDSDIQQTTLQTDIGQLIGTIPYMSPEQVSGDPNDLDTRSDVYAMGVIAYEILAGRLPYDLQRKMIHEAARIIKEEEPTRLSSIDRTLKGDVETIVAKALEKDKVRRYQSAESLASDIRRYLKDEPIAARPASTWYQLTKFSKRNRGLVIGLGAAFFLLIAGVIGTSIGLHRAVIARDNEAWARTEADEQRDRAIKAEKETARRADELKRVSDFQASMLSQVDPTTAGARLTEDVIARFETALTKEGVPQEGGERVAQVELFRAQWRRVNTTDAARELIVRTILKPAVEAVEARFKDQPVVDAALRQVLASLYEKLGLYDEALPLQSSALEIRRRELGDEHPDTLISLDGMGVLLTSLGRLAEAEAFSREVVEKKRRVLGAEHSGTLTSAINLGSVLMARGRLDEAVEYLEETLEASRRSLGTEHETTLATISTLAGVLEQQGKLDRAEPLYRQVLDGMRRIYEADHLSVLTAGNNLASVLSAMRKFSEAEPLFRESLEGCRRTLGENHRLTLHGINNLGYVLHQQGRLGEAEPYLREAFQVFDRVLGPEHPDTLTAGYNLGTLLSEQARLAESEECLRGVVEKQRRVLGSEHPDTLGSIGFLGNTLQLQAKWNEAEPLLRESLKGLRASLGDGHPNTLLTANNLGLLLLQSGRPTEAEPLFRESLAGMRRAVGETHPHVLTLLSNMGKSLRAQGKLAEAEPYYREALEKQRSVLGEDHQTTLTSIANLAVLLEIEGKTAEAETCYQEALEKHRRVLGDEHPNTIICIKNMAELLRDQGRLTEAEPYFREAAERYEATLGTDHPAAASSMSDLADLWERQLRHDLAGPLWARLLASRKKTLAPDDWRIAHTKSRLGGSFLWRGSFAEAEPLLIEGFNGLAEATGTLRTPKNLQREACERVVKLYESWDKAEPGKGYDAKAAEWKAKLDALTPPP